MDANKVARVGYIVISLILYVLAVLSFINIILSFDAFSMICAALLIAYGVIRLIGYFSKDFYCLAFQYDFALGVLVICLGAIILIRNPDKDTVVLLLGIIALVDALFKIQIAADARKFGLMAWNIIFILSIVVAVSAFFMMMMPFRSLNIGHIVLGLMVLFEGIMNHYVMLVAVKSYKGTEHSEGKERNYGIN